MKKCKVCGKKLRWWQMKFYSFNQNLVHEKCYLIDNDRFFLFLREPPPYPIPWAIDAGCD